MYVYRIYEIYFSTFQSTEYEIYFSTFQCNNLDASTNSSFYPRPSMKKCQASNPRFSPSNNNATK